MLSRDDILRLIKDKVHHPASARELAQLLRVPREERSNFKRQLKSLVTDGQLLQIRGNRFGVAEKMDVVVGRLQTNPGGFGFVVPEHADPGERKDIFIAPPNAGSRDASSASCSAARKRSSGDSRSTAPASAMSCRSIAAS
jgi:ribonuclease R